MLSSQLTDAELDTFTLIERTVSVFSLLGCVFIIGTFAASKSFHKPINRLVFYASIGNMMTNVATLMARSYVAFAESAVCQFQAFLIQMFMPADAFWTLAMAVNVYLTFYYKYDAQMLRKMEIPYLICCYGIPFAVAITYVFINDPTKGRVYGNATLWCWVQQTWDVWRIITFYGPVWVVIFVTFFIYIRAGREIYLKHKQLKDLNYTSHYDPEPLPMNDPLNAKTTEVSVSFSDAQESIDLSPLGANVDRHHSVSGQSMKQYSVTISAKPPVPPVPTENEFTTPAPPTSNNRVSHLMQPTTPGSTQATSEQHQQFASSSGNHNKHVFSRRKANYDAHNAAWSYTKCALLFFTAMLVTWIPSSANRVYSVVHNGEINLPLEYMSAFVLPLQGFWNAIIYMTTSWKACKMLWEDIMASFGKKTLPSDASNSPHDSAKSAHVRSPSRLQRVMGRSELGLVASSGRAGPFHRSSKSSETESMEELANVIRGAAFSP